MSKRPLQIKHLCCHRLLDYTQTLIDYTYKFILFPQLVSSLEVFPCLNLEDLNFRVHFFFKTQKPHKPWFAFFILWLCKDFWPHPHTLCVFPYLHLCKCAKLSLIFAHSIPLTITRKFSCLQACAPIFAHTLKDRILNSTNALTLVGSFERSWSRWSHHQFEPTNCGPD